LPGTPALRVNSNPISELMKAMQFISTPRPHSRIGEQQKGQVSYEWQ
jgi:hypothetical protein